MSDDAVAVAVKPKKKKQVKPDDRGTVLEFAQELLRIEASKDASIFHQWTRPGLVLVMNRKNIKTPALRELGSVESAMEMLADRGLLRREREEWEVSPVKPQRYQWSRSFSSDAVRRFLEG